MPLKSSGWRFESIEAADEIDAVAALDILVLENDTRGGTHERKKRVVAEAARSSLKVNPSSDV